MLSFRNWKVNKTNIFFSRFEWISGERNQIFRTKAALHFADSLSGLLKRATEETQKIKGARKLEVCKLWINCTKEESIIQSPEKNGHFSFQWYLYCRHYALNTSKLNFGCYLSDIWIYFFIALNQRTLVQVICYCFTSKQGRISGHCILNSVRNKCLSL